MQSRYLIGLIGVTACICTSCAQQDGSQEIVVETTFVHTYGVEVPPQDWNERGKNGQVISTLSNGVQVSNSYSGGILEGETSYTFPYRTNIQKIDTYANNAVTRSVEFYPSGAPRQETTYLADGQRQVRSWYENGAPQNIETYDSNGLLTKGESFDLQHHRESWVDGNEGMRVVRDEYGQLVSRDTIQNGVMTYRTTYHANGAPKSISPYSNSGMVHGVLKTYLPDGEPDTVEEWVDGKQQGITIVFRNGEKYAEISYVNGVKNGLERHFLDGDLVVEEITWKDNLKHGPAMSYVGETMVSEWFYQGKPVTKGNYEILIRSLTE